MRFPFSLSAHRSSLAVAGASLALLAGSSLSQAATITWNGSVNNDWNTAGNWSSNTVPLATDQVVINGNYTVLRTGALSMTSVAAGTAPYAFTLAGGATFNNASGAAVATDKTGSFRVSGTASANNNSLIDTGSTLTTDRFWLGNNPGAGVPTSSLSNKVTTATIRGTVIAERDFVGYRPQGSNATEGGWIMHIDGGSFTAPVFNFQNSGSQTNTNLTAHVVISNGGTMSMGNVNANWMGAAQIHYVDFLDGTGSITFNKSTLWNDLAGVQSLIDGNFIRSTAGATLQITDNTTSWTVTAVPEPSTYALLVGGALLSIAFVRRKRAK